LAVGLSLTVGFLALAARGWGGWGPFLAHPARLGAALAALLLTVVATFSGFSLSRGRRDDPRDQWLFLPFLLLFALVGWMPAFADRRDLLTLDGDALRYVGLTVFVGGGVLRIWPMFVLGRRFSAFVAIQERHELVTDGVYRLVRHPSYLGGLVSLIGWILVFRGGGVLLLMVPLVWLTVARVKAEETLLASEFGGAYAAYRCRTWRLVPFVY
jgi:protein-S-isoprenylcysteine O-methyltransferase Ste14